MSLCSDLNTVTSWHHCRTTAVKLSFASLWQLQQFWIQPPAATVSKAWGLLQSTTICELTIILDTSKVAWGGCLHLPKGNCKLIGELQVIPAYMAVCEARGVWMAAQIEDYIHLLELRAVLNMLHAF